FVVYWSGYHQHLPSFPTRRSSDLSQPVSGCSPNGRSAKCSSSARQRCCSRTSPTAGACSKRARSRRWGRSTSAGSRRTTPLDPRSEEHTSELQSLAYLVCRLLLEK